ncbi:nucleotidyl transferase AbiEii/AbiGii toxin family protein [Myxococcota bacterium]|nr:nucleotidyl transferase AbiEii/AbiGii toxin family protein [Myxococcota bacterium]
MRTSRLSSTQVAILQALAGFEPRWTLTGDAALAGFHLGHRTTRDLDLFWQGHDTLGDLASEVAGALAATGFTVRGLRRTPAFARLHVESADGAVEVDLVADPVARVEAPERVTVEGTEIEIDSKGEIFANKLNALLSRSELRDLIDVEALMGAGLDLRVGLEAAARKDGAMSAATLAWVLSSLPVSGLAQRERMPEDASSRLVRFRDELCAELVRLSAPD